MDKDQVIKSPKSLGGLGGNKKTKILNRVECPIPTWDFCLFNSMARFLQGHT